MQTTIEDKEEEKAEEEKVEEKEDDTPSFDKATGGRMKNKKDFGEFKFE